MDVGFDATIFFPYQLIYQAKTEPVVFTAPVAPTWTTRSPWPDLVPTRPRPVVNYLPWTFVPPPKQVWFPPNYWPDLLLKKPQPLDTQPLIWTGRTIVAVVPVMAWTNWPDFAPKKPVPLNYDPLTLTQLAPQVWFPRAPWDDFTRRKPQPLDTQLLAWSTFTPPTTTFFLTPDRWPDFAIRARLPLNYPALAFPPTSPSPFNSFVNWPDFVWGKKVPLNYDPLTLVQTVRTPWNELTRWPDFVPIRKVLGLPIPLQQFLAMFPGKILGATATMTISAFEVNSDGFVGAIYVVQSQPAVNAVVSIHEVGILGGSITP